MNEFIITFRECLEASLIVGIIYTLLEKNNLKRELQQLWLAVFAAIIASGIVAVCINYAKESIGNVAIQSLFEGLSMYVTAILLWYVIFWLSKHVSEKSAMEDKTKKAVETAGWGIFLVVFFAILREGFETALFLMGSFNMSGSFSYLGFFAGMISAILIGYAIVVQGRKINLRAFFRGTTLMLVIFASGMVAYGTHEIEEFIVKGNHLESIGIKQKSEIPRVWNVLEPKDEVDNTIFYSYNLKGKNKYTHLLHDNGRVGNFFKGFFGYNSNPNWPEVILWLLSLLFGIKMWKSFYFKKKLNNN
ncbi:FTR1 family protein [Methylophilaceae bacterium]|nr:FTR1 family protein [Methylophilaceae bacterium]